MLFPIEVINYEVDPVDTELVLLQSAMIVSVYKNQQYEDNSIILYKENRRLVEYEIAMTVTEFWSYLKRYSLNSLLQ